MKTRHFPLRFLLPALFVCCLIIHPLDAQEPHKQMWFQWDDLVYPAKVSEYIEAAKAVNEFLKEQDYPYPMYAYSSDDFHFYYTMPISSYAAIDTMQMIWGKIFEKVGEEKMAPLWKAFIGTQEYGRNRIYVHRPDLSYHSESDYLGDKEANFRSVYINYPMYGMGLKFEEVMKKWIDLHTSKNSEFTYDIFEVVMGDEDPCYFFISRAENAASYYARNMEVWGIIGEEGRQLQKEMFSLLRKVDPKHLWYRKDLSYIPGE